MTQARAKGTADLVILITGALLVVESAYAEDGETPVPSQTQTPTAEATVALPPVGPPKKSTSSGPLLVKPGARKGRRREQKETEGTEAPGRFEADTILKSPYHLNGQPLEVDPD